MPTTLSTISSTAITTRWREPYASEALNRKFAAIMPAGVYRGLRLEVSAVDLSVDVAEDAVNGDHVAVFETEDGYSISYRDRLAGRFTFDLSSFISGEVITIAASAGYSVGVDTAAEFQGYTQAEFDSLTSAQRLGLVVLGTVTRSASGIIPAININHDGRDVSFLNRAAESVPWNPIIKNGGFELGDIGETFAHASPFWETSTDNANFSYTPSDTDSQSGDKSLELVSASAGTCIATATQTLYLAVTPGRQIRVAFYKRVLQAATGTPTGVVRLSFEDKAGGSDTDVDLSFDINAVDGSFVGFDGVTVIPANMTVLKTVKVITSGTYAAPGVCHRIDNIRSWYEVNAEDWFVINSSISGEVLTDSLFVGNRPLGIDAAKLSYDGTDLVVESRDPTTATPGIVIPRIVAVPSIAGGIEYTLVWQSLPPGSMGYRKYVSPTGQLVETVNAKWDNTSNLWTKDVNGVAASRYNLTNTSYGNQSQIPGTNSWGDGAWVAATAGIQREIYIPSSGAQHVENLNGPGADQADSDVYPGYFNSWFGGIKQAAIIPVSGFLKVGDELLTARIDVYASSTSPWEAVLYEQIPPTTTISSKSDIAATSTAAEQSMNLTSISFNAATNILESGKSYFIHVRTQNTGVTNFRFYGCLMTYVEN